MDETPSLLDLLTPEVSHVEDRLYAGGAPGLERTPWQPSWDDLREAGTTTLVSLAPPRSAPPGPTRWLRYYVEDSVLAPGVDVRWLANIVRRLDRALDRNQVLYVHCLAGVSRTGLVLAGWYMRRHGVGFDQALTALRERRRCLDPNPGFVKILRDFEASQLGRRPR